MLTFHLEARQRFTKRTRPGLFSVSTAMDDPFEQPDESREGRFLPYPTSTLSPKILPNDLTTFKSRGVSQVHRQFQQKLVELHEEYRQLIDQFNWNKLIYEARFGFEPTLGQTYHLYDLSGVHTLSMIEPGQWPGKKWIGSFQLQVDGQWQPQELAEDFDVQDWVESLPETAQSR